MPKRRTATSSGGSAAKKPAPNRVADGGGGGCGGDAEAEDSKAMDLEASGAEVEAAPPPWLPTASEIKPALDAVRAETGLLPELNGMIAAFADLPPPRWTLALGSTYTRYVASCRIGGLARSTRLRLLSPELAEGRTTHWMDVGPDACASGVPMFGCDTGTPGTVWNRGHPHTITQDLREAEVELRITPLPGSAGVIAVHLGSAMVGRVTRDDLATCSLFKGDEHSFVVIE